MRKFYQIIVNNPKKIIICFVLLAVVGAVLSGMVGVNYNMTDFLPEDTASTVSLEVMEEEFEGGIPNARVRVKDVSIPEALDYKEKILSCEGVTDVAAHRNDGYGYGGDLLQRQFRSFYRDH